MNKKKDIIVFITSIFITLFCLVCSGMDLARGIIFLKKGALFSFIFFVLLAAWVFTCGIINLKGLVLLWKTQKSSKWDESE